MTVKLLQSPEIKRVLKAIVDSGVDFDEVDVRVDSVRVRRVKDVAREDPYDRWKEQDSRCDRPSRR